ncbi:cell division protein FtsK [Alkalibacterium olivapovliticus]|uniref:FtsK domain-containing protein n=1 Tax=Alkalibacterium olivapovliticus TaxID=99907 RepID=A0A2T0VU57_9LACT|nr:cell division protein FtsK [Alkalibacterium olivapovliticus]PRY74847.1 hypothetical protein CLV38_1384 [Alkalibacterium olivapovliticus]
MFSLTYLATFILQCLNMALDLNGETSYTNSFMIEATQEGFYFIPLVPSSFAMDSKLYEDIFSITNAVMYPHFTVLKQSGPYFVPWDKEDIHSSRAFFFPWLEGIPERLISADESCNSEKFSNKVPLLNNFSLDYNKVTSVAIAGNSGSGKSYHLVYWLTILNEFSDLIIVDPKLDSPARWAMANKVELITPSRNRNTNDFVNEVTSKLSAAKETILNRQEALLKNPDLKFKHLTIVIDELLALTTGVPTKIKNSFFNLLSEISLLGRATNVHLLMVSQRFDANALPVSVREQCNVLIQLGNINKKTTQFLFPDLDKPENIVIPRGKGTGLIQVIDGELPPNVMPFLTPTFNMKGMI